MADIHARYIEKALRIARLARTYRLQEQNCEKSPYRPCWTMRKVRRDLDKELGEFEVIKEDLELL
jgi:hypothetical protein